tara:strand:+ start:222 stop:2369 length:2148 start_codon:yes stop_codon:yes gene_type:complete
MSIINFPPDQAKTLPVKIAGVELKRFLDRISKPILEKIIENSPFNTTVILHHISQPDENKELLQIWYQLELEESPGKEKWDQITDIFYGYDPNYSEMDQNNLTPKVRDYLNTFKLDGFNNWDFTTFEIRQGAKAGVRISGHLLPIPEALNTETSTFEELNQDQIMNLSHEKMIKYLISSYAKNNNVPIPDPNKINNSDLLYSLFSENDQITLGLFSYISNFFGIPDHEDFNPLSDNYKPSENFSFRNARKAILFVQDCIDFYEGMYGFIERFTNAEADETIYENQKIIDFGNYKENENYQVKLLISKFLKEFEVQCLLPDKIQTTDKLIMLTKYDRKTALSIKKSFMMHFDCLYVDGLDTDLENQTNPDVQSLIDFVEMILEDTGSSYNEKNNLDPLKSVLETKSNDKEFVKNEIIKANYGIEFINEELKKDKNFILEILNNSKASDIEEIVEELRDDKEVMRTAFKNHYDFGLIEFLGPKLKKDREFFISLLKNYFEKEGETFFQYPFDQFDEAFRDDKEIMLIVLNAVDSFYESELLGPSLKKDFDIASKIISKSGGQIQYFDDAIKKNEEIAVIALKNDFYNFKYIHTDLQQDQEILKIYKEQALEKLEEKFDNYNDLTDELKEMPEFKALYKNKYEQEMELIKDQIQNADYDFGLDLKRPFSREKSFYLDLINYCKSNNIENKVLELIQQELDYSYLSEEEKNSIIQIINE